MYEVILDLDKNSPAIQIEAPFLKGEAGKSAYDIWLEQGNEGTEQDFLDSLKGEGGVSAEDIVDVVKNANFVYADLSDGEESGVPAPVNADTLGGYTLDDVINKAKPTEAENLALINRANASTVKFTAQTLTDAQKAVARGNIGAVTDVIEDYSNSVEWLITENITIQVVNFIKYGKLCYFCLQFIVNTTITGDYGFHLVEFPFYSVMRVWINNGTLALINQSGNQIMINSSQLAAGNYMWTGFYFTNE